MICENCGSPLIGTEQKCPKCGNEIKKQEISKEIKNKYYNGNDETLIREYMGKKANMFLNQKFNPSILVVQLIFGFVYLLFRKMYFYGFLWFAILVGLSIIPETQNYSFMFSLIMAIYFSLNFKDLYLVQAKEQVDKIKGKNPTATKEDLMVLCRKKGGVNLTIGIIFGILYVLALIGFILSLIFGMDTVIYNIRGLF